MNKAVIAFNRFGLGARAGERPDDDAKGALLDQLRRFDPAPAAIAARPSTREGANELTSFLARRRALKRSGKTDDNKQMRRMRGRRIRQSLIQDIGARGAVAIASDTPFAERLVHFWSNHFAISIRKRQVVTLAGPHEFEAIRPNIMGSFADLLRAASLHPAMLIYLDQPQSTGPSSLLGRRVSRRGKRKLGINENLAREIMELHTLGADGGYTQADVTEFSRAMTGWTLAGLPRARRAREVSGVTAFADYQHEPGARTIMGRRFGQEGEEQSLAVLDFFAHHPSTARHIATKLARHFCADDPPASLIRRLERRFVETGGDLPGLYRVLVEAEEIWSGETSKFRTPDDWLIAAMRGLAIAPAKPQGFAGALRELGQLPWSPASPKGYDDLAASWAAGNALLRRVETAERLARLARFSGRGNASELADTLFPDALGEPTRLAIRRAASGQQALALLLASPEMMRR